MNNGKEFENYIGRLLRVSGYIVRGEELLGTKRVDLIAETTTFGKRRTYAVECKDHSHSLGREQVAQIVAEYADLLDSALIDGLLLVTRNGLTPAAAGYVQNSRSCSHQTVLEIERSMLDFSSYLNYLVRNYVEDIVSGYYVAPRTADGLDLMAVVLDWIESDDDQPVAIVGSYGMGKTTFSRHIASVLAERAISDPAARIPVLLPLGLISAEQTLDGLLGRHFTSIHNVRNYNLHTFEDLNRLGKLVVFLDGFDEMKHTLTWNEFRYNFQQILRLVVPRSKVVVLGRPTTFISEEEKIYILHGRYRREGKEFHVPDWPDFSELELAPFDGDQIAKFLTRYFSPMLDSMSKRSQMKTRASQVMCEISSRRMRDLAQRPVQLRMLADVLPDWQGDFSNLTAATLYDHFIDRMIERELDKTARQRFTLPERRRFARELSWWLWTEKGGAGLTPDAIPDSIISAFTASTEDREAVRRDLVSACFLERKHGGILYFPHRSFQEFLVAEKVHELIGNKCDDLKLLSEAVVGEVGRFLSGILEVKSFMRWLGRIGSYRGMASRRLFSVLADDPLVSQAVVSSTADIANAGEIAFAEVRRNPWHGLFRVLIARTHAVEQQIQRDTIDYFLSNITKNSRFVYGLFNFFCALAMAGAREDKKHREAVRVINFAVERFGYIETTSSLSALEDDVQDDGELFEEDIQESVEARLDHQKRPLRAAGKKKATVRNGVAKSLWDFAREVGLYSDKAIDIEHLLGRAAYLLRGYAMFEEWADPRANLAAEFGLPQFIRLEPHVPERAQESMNDSRGDEGTRTRETKRGRTVKHNFSKRRN